MQSLEEQHIEDMENAVAQKRAMGCEEVEGMVKKRRPIDVLAVAYGGETRAQRRAFKSRLKRLVRQEARKQARSK